MILVDTSVWGDHPRRGDAALVALLDHSAVVMHPFVLGEIACGSLRDRNALLGLLGDLPGVVVASDEEAMAFIEYHRLHGLGIGYIDVHPLASVALTGGSRLWTRDRRLGEIATRRGCAYRGSAH